MWIVRDLDSFQTTTSMLSQRIIELTVKAFRSYLGNIASVVEQFFTLFWKFRELEESKIQAVSRQYENVATKPMNVFMGRHG